MALTFERIVAVWDGKRDAVRFIGRDAGRAVQCFISMKTLQDRFGTTSDAAVELLQVYRKNADLIHRAAERRYLSGAADTLDLVVLRTADL